MDINLPGMNGVQATAKLVDKFPDVNVMILSIHDDESYVSHALKTGAQGYLLKEMDSDALIDAIKVVSEGGSYLHPKITHNLVQEYRQLAKSNKRKNIRGKIEYRDRKSTRLNSSHVAISYAVFCLKKKKKNI